MAKTKRSTLRDVASKAEVSPSTVSMILNNSERSFSNEVRKRVLKTAKNLKYIPIGVGRPNTGRSKSKIKSMKSKVAILVYSPSSFAGMDIYGMVHKGAELELNEHKVDLVIQSINSFMLSNDIIGVLSCSTPKGNKKQLIGNLPSVTCMGKIKRHSQKDHITYNNREISILAAEYLLKKRHKHIGYISIIDELYDERSKIFEQVIIKSGKKYSCTIPTDHQILFSNPVNLEKLLREYLSRPDRPTALFIPADTITSVVYPILYSLGIIPGKDIEIVTCNNDFLRIAGLIPRPTVIDIRSFDIGRLSAIQLLKRIRHLNIPPLKIEIRPTLIEGSEWDNFIKNSCYYI